MLIQLSKAITKTVLKTSSQSTQPQNDLAHSWQYDFGKDYVLPALFAIAAACVAYYIFFAETKRDRKRDLDNKAQEQSDKLMFFATSVDSALKTAIQQKNYLKDYLRKIKTDDVNFHLIQYVPLNNFQRIVEVLDLEIYLLAYVNEYSQNRQASIKEYKNILANIDFLYHKFRGILDQIQKAQQFDFERKSDFKNTFYKIFNAIALIYEALDNDEISYQRFRNIIEGFTRIHQDNYDLTFYFEHFFIPINEFFTEYFDQNAHPSEVLINAAVASRDGKQMFNHIRVENKQLCADLSGDFKATCNSILDLKKLASKLINDLNGSSS